MCPFFSRDLFQQLKKKVTENEINVNKWSKWNNHILYKLFIYLLFYIYYIYISLAAATAAVLLRNYFSEGEGLDPHSFQRNQIFTLGPHPPPAFLVASHVPSCHK